MRRLAKWAVALGAALLGVGHMLFALPNFGYARECDSSMLSFTGCMEFYEGMLAAVAGASLVAGALLVIRRSFVQAALVVFAGTATFNLFFWVAAIPTELSSSDFGYLTLPLPTVSLGVLLGLAASGRRERGLHRSPHRGGT